MRAETTNTGVLPAPAVVWAVNCGGAAYVGKDGVSYQADKNFSGGQTYSTTVAISATEDDVLYQSERHGNFSYNIPVLNGTYSVTLKFAEIYNTSAGQRLFNVKIEGQQAITNLDLYAKGGRFAAYDQVFFRERDRWHAQH